MSRIYVTTSIPYVNARPHIGHALELVQADALARHWRSRGWETRLLGGTDDHAPKNAQAAETAGAPVQAYVDAMSNAFEELAGLLDLRYDYFIRTSRDPRHRPGVERLWQQCLASGDLYRSSYQGLYCTGCEQFYLSGELADDVCPEHDAELEVVSEENWFFRLSRYAEQLRALIEDGRLLIQPEGRRNEVLAAIGSGLRDFSISRPVQRTRGWGIPVPGDPDQTIYVWWDALGNYITALGYGTGAEEYRRWWVESDRRVHVIGKGILRFHAIYWPAMLLSAGEPLPTEILVHDYLTAEGRKISKSLGNVIEPAEVVAELGSTAVRWWLLRAVPRTDDADFRRTAAIELANQDLAEGIGNLVTRTVTMVQRYRNGEVSVPAKNAVAEGFSLKLDDHFERFDFRGAAGQLMSEVARCNRRIADVRPWELAAKEREDDSARARLDEVLGELIQAERSIVRELAPFLPDLAARADHQLGGDGPRVGLAAPLFSRLQAPGRDL